MNSVRMWRSNEDRELLESYAKSAPNAWILTRGAYADSRAFNVVPVSDAVSGATILYDEASIIYYIAKGSLKPGWWVFQVPAYLRDVLDENGQPRAKAAPAKQRQLLRGELDPVTARLVASSIPIYRNSDRCPKPNCGRVGYFKQMALCCDVHGAFHP